MSRPVKSLLESIEDVIPFVNRGTDFDLPQRGEVTMNIKQKKILTLVGLPFVVILSQSSYAQEACSSATQELIKSLDESFRELKQRASTDKEKASIIPGLLNRAIGPLIKKFGDKITQVDSAQITRKFQDFKTKTPIYDGIYTDFVAQVPRLESKSQDLINHNSRQVTRFYKLGEATDLTRSLEEHIYTDFSAESVEDLGIVYKQLGSIVTPVGEYGREFAQDMLRTTQILMDFASNNLKDEAKEVFASAPELLKEETARAKASHSENSKIELTPLSGMIEGIVTFHQLTSILLSSKISGVQDGAEALRLLVQSGATKAGLVSEITMQIPMGVVGPSALSGLGIRNPLTLDPVSGKLKVTSNLQAYFAHVQKKLVDASGKKRVCPMASLLRGLKPSSDTDSPEAPISGIQIIAESYLKVFEQVRAQRK